jgi:hypothetical protein
VATYTISDHESWIPINTPKEFEIVKARLEKINFSSNSISI